MKIINNTKLIGETIKEYLLCISIVVAAIWAVFTFNVTQYKALHPKPVIESTIEVSSVTIKDRKYIKSIVTLFNKGNDPVWIELKGPSLSLRAIEPIDNGQLNSTLISTQYYQGYLNNGMLEYGTIQDLQISENSQVELAYISSVENHKELPIQITFMAGYRHAQTDKELSKRNYDEKNKVFTTQVNEYVYFN